MISHLTKIVPFLFVSFTLLSCGEQTETSDNVESTPVETVPENDGIAAEGNPVKSDGPFNIKSGEIHYDDKNLEGNVVGQYIFSFDNYGNLLKLEETIDGETSLYLYDEDAKKGVTQFAGRKANKAYMRQGEINRFVAMRSQSGFAQKDNEELLGKTCEVYANNAVNDAGESKVVYWMHEGICLKEINRLAAGYSFEATKFEEKAIAKDVFSLLDDGE